MELAPVSILFYPDLSLLDEPRYSMLVGAGAIHDDAV